MIPPNPDNNQPLIYRICDAAGVFHLVAPFNHTHSQDEVEGLIAALNSKAPINHGHDFIGEDTEESYANVTASEGQVHIEVRNQSGGGECEITPSNIGNFIRALEDPDSTPTTNSDKLVTSGGVKAALEGKQNTLTFDSTPTAESTNPVTSGGVKAALDGKQDTLTFDSTPTANSTNPVTSGGVKAALEEFIIIDASVTPLIPTSRFVTGKKYQIIVRGPVEKWVSQYFTKGEAASESIDIMGNKVVTGQSEFGMLVWRDYESNRLQVIYQGEFEDQVLDD